jgi:hypothetical protein
MTTPSNARTFDKPHRTPGARLFNFGGRRLRRWGWHRPLKVQEILDSACRFTGLSDWGDDRFQEPLQVLVESLEEEARLHPLGRLLLKVTLRHFAANRLWMRHYVKLHPEALEEPVSRPLFVIGLPRTGTTLLHNLLGQDASRRSPRLWEVLQPAPSVAGTRGRRDYRMLKARALVAGVHLWGAPNLRRVHPLHADAAEECTPILFNTFVCPAFFLFGGVSRYLEWLRNRGRALLPWVYEQHRLSLQVLQHQGRRAPWLLKSPAHSFALEELLALYPDACVVQTHRDMNQVIPSACSLFAIMQSIYSDEVDCRKLGPELARLLGDFLRERADTGWEDHSGRVDHVDYRSLVSDPIGTVRDIYAHFDLDYDDGMEQRMRYWLARNPANKHGVHHYDLEQFGLTESDIKRDFAAYQERFRAAAHLT